MELKRIGAYIDIAIQREEESYALYMDLSTRLRDRSARDALFLLASEEKQHKAFLERYRDGGFGEEALRMDQAIDYRIAEHMDRPAIDKDIK